MDYICATALVAYQLFGLFARLLVFRERRYLVIASIFTALLCGQHVYRMLFIHFDYGYHVKVNVIVGKLCWCLDTNAILFFSKFIPYVYVWWYCQPNGEAIQTSLALRYSPLDCSCSGSTKISSFLSLCCYRVNVLPLVSGYGQGQWCYP